MHKAIFLLAITLVLASYGCKKCTQCQRYNQTTGVWTSDCSANVKPDSLGRGAVCQ